MTPYQPFINAPAHVKALEGQRFVVLRAPAVVSGACRQIQETLRRRLRGSPVSYPAQAHVTLCGFAAGTSLQDVQELVRVWAPVVPSLRIELARVASFPPPYKIPIVEVRKNGPLYSALATLRARAEEQRLVVSTVMPVEQWTFHMSLAYCSLLDDTRWQEVRDFAQALQVPAVHDDVSTVEVVVFDGEREQSGGVYELGAALSLEGPDIRV